MAVKKAASRKRTTTTRAKSARSTTTRRGTKARSAPKLEHVEQVERAEDAVAIDAPAAAETTSPAAAPAPARGRATRDDERPSRFMGAHYLHATGPQAGDGSPTARSAGTRPGKWLIFVSRSRIDALWEDIRRAVEMGRLGHAAKVSTALPNPLSPDPKKHIVCVYTPDEDDAADVRRVREALRALGVTWKIPYKSDAATRAGEHEVTTGGPAAKYYE